MADAIVNLSDMSKSVTVLEETIMGLDVDINQRANMLMKLQNEMSNLITQRDALIATMEQIRLLRGQMYPEYNAKGENHA